MNNFTCVIIEDEPVARKGIAEYVSRIEWLKCIGTFEDALQFDNAIHTPSGDTPPLPEPDFLFADIEMPGISGLDYLASTHISSAVILITAYESYALRGYELDITDYLLKPVPFSRFLKAVNKARAYKEALSAHSLPTANGTFHNSIFVKSDRVIHRITLSDILYAEGMENYVKIYTSTQGMIISRTTMKSFHATLPTSTFMQVHKSFIVNISHIQSLDGNRLQLLDGSEIPVSKSFKTHLLTLLTPH